MPGRHAAWMDWSRFKTLCPAGMFADLQLVALRAMDDLVDAHKLVLASAAADNEAPIAYTSEWMASARWHPFWLFALAHVIRANESRCTRLGYLPSSSFLFLVVQTLVHGMMPTVILPALHGGMPQHQYRVYSSTCARAGLALSKQAASSIGYCCRRSNPDATCKCT